MLKQDKQGVRSARDLEQKYGFGKTFREVKGSLKVATDTAEQAEKKAMKAQSEVLQLSDSISLKVDNGETTAQIKLKVGNREIPATIDMKGLVTFSNLANADGTTVINGSNITTGQILADLIKAGTLKSKDGKSVVIDLDKGEGTFTGSFRTSLTSTNEFGEQIVNYSEMDSGRITVTTDNDAEILNFTDITSESVTVSGIGNGGANSTLKTDELKLTRAGADNVHRARINVTNDDVSMALSTGEYSDNRTALDFSVSPGKAKITGLTAPEGDSDAVNKGYVDNHALGMSKVGNEVVSPVDIKAPNLLADNPSGSESQTGVKGKSGHFYMYNHNNDGAYGLYHDVHGEILTVYNDGTKRFYGNVNGAATGNAVIGAPNNLLHSGNEFTYASPGFSGGIWHNYRTSDWNANGNITEYYFGNGKGGFDNVSLYAGNFYGKLYGREYRCGSIDVPAYSTSGSNGSNYYGDVSVSAFFDYSCSSAPRLFLQVATNTTGVTGLEPVSWDKNGIYKIRIHRSSPANGVSGFTVYYLAVC